VVALFALLVILFVSLSVRIGRIDLGGPIIFMASGVVAGQLLNGGHSDPATIRAVAEVTLALMLFHDAAHLQPRELRADSRFTGRLLLVGLPLTMGAGFLLARGLFPGIGVWLAVLLGAALSPTDAGLGSATVLNPVVPVRVRRVLNVESGLNDGLATPVVLFAVAAAGGFAGGSPEHAVLEALLEILIGSAFGIVVGYLAGRLITYARRMGWAEIDLIPVATLVIPLLSYYGAAELGGNGFIAAFVAGAAYAHGMDSVPHLHESLGLTSMASTLLGYAIWMLIGLTLADHLSALSLTLLRMAPVALCLLGSGLRPQTVAFIGWFGPRGLASVIFALIALEDLGNEADAGRVVAVIAETVVLSVFAHGFTAAPWASRYGRWVAMAHPAVEIRGAVEPLSTLRHGRGAVGRRLNPGK
jgi:NhaP-type Na+/H+ or K+/H+ antiporter